MGCYHSNLALSTHVDNQSTKVRSPFTTPAGEAAVIAATATASAQPKTSSAHQPDSNILLGLRTNRDLFDPNSNVEVDLNSSGNKQSNNQTISFQQSGRGSSRQHPSSRSLLQHPPTSTSRAPTAAQHQADIGFDSEDFNAELEADDNDPDPSSVPNSSPNDFRFSINDGRSPHPRAPGPSANGAANPDCPATATISDTIRPTPSPLRNATAPGGSAAHADNSDGSSQDSQRLLDTLVPLIVRSVMDLGPPHMGMRASNQDSGAAAAGEADAAVAAGGSTFPARCSNHQQMQTPLRLPAAAAVAAAAANTTEGLASDSSCGGGGGARRPTLTRGFTRDSFLMAATTTTGGVGASGFMMHTATAREGVLLGADAAWPPFHMGNPLQLVIGELLGRGGCGSVYRGEWRGRPVAVKVVQQIVPLPPTPAAAAAAAVATGAAPPPLITPLVDYFGSSNSLALFGPGTSGLNNIHKPFANLNDKTNNNNNYHNNNGGPRPMPPSRDTTAAAAPSVPKLPDAHASVNRLRHPNVLRTYAYAVLSVPPQLDGVVPARHEHHVILELCDGGTLRGWLDRLYQQGFLEEARTGVEGGGGGGGGGMAGRDGAHMLQPQRQEGCQKEATTPCQQQQRQEVVGCGGAAAPEGRRCNVEEPPPGPRAPFDTVSGAELTEIGDTQKELGTTSTAPKAVAETSPSAAMYDRLIAASASRTGPAATATGADTVTGGAADVTSIATPSGTMSRPLRGLTLAKSQRLQSIGRAWLSDTLPGDDCGGGGGSRTACEVTGDAPRGVGCGGGVEAASGVLVGSYGEAGSGMSGGKEAGDISASYGNGGDREVAAGVAADGGFCTANDDGHQAHTSADADADVTDPSYGSTGTGLMRGEVIVARPRASGSGAADVPGRGRPSLESARMSPSPPPAALSAAWAGAAAAEQDVPYNAPMMQAMPYNTGYGVGSLGSHGAGAGGSTMAPGYLDSESVVHFSATGIVQQHYVILSDDDCEDDQAEGGAPGRQVKTPPSSGPVTVTDRVRHSHLYGNRAAAGSYGSGGGSSRLPYGGLRIDEPLQQLEEGSEEGRQSWRSRGDASFSAVTTSAATTSAVFNSSLVTAATNTTAAAGGDGPSGGTGAPHESRSRRYLARYGSENSCGGWEGGTDVAQQQGLPLPTEQPAPLPPPPPAPTSGAAAAAPPRYLTSPSPLGSQLFRTAGAPATAESTPPPLPPPPPPPPAADAGKVELGPVTALLNRRAVSIVNSILRAAAAAKGNGGAAAAIGGAAAPAANASGDAKLAAAAAVPASDPMTSGQLRHLVTALEVLAEVAAGLCYLHGIGMVHGDVKSGNVLLKLSPDQPLGFQVKLADFGFSRVLEHGSHTYLSRPSGTLAYLSPELVTSHRLSTAADMYAFGLLVWEVVTTQPLFRGLQTAQVLYAKTHHADWAHLHWPPWCPPEARTFARRCSESQPAARLNAQQAHAQLAAMRAKYSQQQQQK